MLLFHSNAVICHTNYTIGFLLINCNDNRATIWVVIDGIYYQIIKQSYK